MEFLDALFVIAIIVFSVIVHEVMHGVAAERLGDPTARLQGRITLNPIPHIDLFGSIILPVILAISQSPFLFGWAKPVPYNPYNLRPGRFSEAIVAGAGPASNLAIAFIIGLVMRIVPMSEVLFAILFMAVIVNVTLCIFNLIPIPPLDGSKILASLLPRSAGLERLRLALESNPFLGFGILLVALMLFREPLGAIFYGAARLIAGV